jgi:probable HAF family extracellular repeat protein
MNPAPAILALSLSAAAASAQTTGFWLMGLPPGAIQGQVNALSRDGSTALGLAGGPAGGGYFRWTAATGREDLGLAAGLPERNGAWAASDSGNIIAGWHFGGSPNAIAFRRVGSQPFETLGLLPQRTQSYAHGISGDGSTVVGHCDSGVTSNSGEAFRWTQATGMQGLGYLHPNGSLSRATDISRDGSTIVGYSQSNGPFHPYEAFVWTQSGGMAGLPIVPGATYPDTSAYAVTANGAVVVGSGGTPSGHSHAVRWEAGAAIDLGTVDQALFSTAYAVSDNGLVIGGSSSGGTVTDTAFIWTQPTSMLALIDYLSLFGVSVPLTFRPEYVQAISGDGLTFGGYGFNTLTNLREGFVATVPAPASAVFLLAPLFASRRRRAH